MKKYRDCNGKLNRNDRQVMWHINEHIVEFTIESMSEGLKIYG